MPDIKKKAQEPSFFDNVYAVAKLVPKGRVTSYGAIAHYLGAKTGARMVGWAMHGCPKGVPAHRVVNSVGLLTGKHHFENPYKMQQLLEAEGITVINDKIQRFNDLFWDPTTEIRLSKTKSRKKLPKSGTGTSKKPQKSAK